MKPLSLVTATQPHGIFTCFPFNSPRKNRLLSHSVSKYDPERVFPLGKHLFDYYHHIWWCLKELTPTDRSQSGEIKMNFKRILPFLFILALPSLFQSFSRRSTHSVVNSFSCNLALLPFQLPLVGPDAAFSTKPPSGPPAQSWLQPVPRPMESRSNPTG